MAKARKPRVGKAGPGTARQGGAKQREKKSPVKVLSSKLSYEGPLFRVYTDVIRENGHESRRDVIRHHGSIVILAVDDARKPDPMVVLERQYRHAAGEKLLEIPAGTLNPGEDPLRGAKRELLEETGMRARRWRKLLRFFASPGFLGEWMQVYLADGLTEGEPSPDDDEQIHVMRAPLSTLIQWIGRGRILDAKTVASVLFFDRMRRARSLRESLE